MLVDVVRLRAGGKKLDREVIRITPPVRGDLRFTGLMLSGNVGGWEPGLSYDAVLKIDASVVGGSSLIPDLRRAWLKTIRGNELLICGVELVGGYTAADAMKQAWWCTVVG